jgi:hypothetical protein
LSQIDLPKPLRQAMASNGVSYGAEKVSFCIK